MIYVRRFMRWVGKLAKSCWRWYAHCLAPTLWLSMLNGAAAMLLMAWWQQVGGPWPIVIAVWIVVAEVSYLIAWYVLERHSPIAVIACAFWWLSFIVGIVLVAWSLATAELIDDSGAEYE